MKSFKKGRIEQMFQSLVGIELASNESLTPVIKLAIMRNKKRMVETMLELDVLRGNLRNQAKIDLSYDAEQAIVDEVYKKSYQEMEDNYVNNNPALASWRDEDFSFEPALIPLSEFVNVQNYHSMLVFDAHELLEDDSVTPEPEEE